jgi:hypothetical protein
VSFTFATDLGLVGNVAYLTFSFVFVRVGLGGYFVELGVVGTRPLLSRSVRVLVVEIATGTSSMFVYAHDVGIMVSAREVPTLRTRAVV